MQMNKLNQNGLREGYWEIILPNDDIIKANFKNGIANGKWAMFNKDGTRIYLAHFKNDVKTGLWVFYRHNEPFETNFYAR